MGDFIEITELDINDNTSSWENQSSLKSTNFGGGLELLMNDKVKDNNNNPKSDIDLEDLNNLENELNNLVDESASSYQPKSDMFSNPSSTFGSDDKQNVRFSFGDGSSIGKSTAESSGENKSWDGYSKFNNIPMNPDKPVSSQPQLSKEEMLREKFKFLRRLEGLEKKGVELSKKYSMESSLQEMMGEYETIMEEKAKQNSVKFQGNMLMACINGIEFLNGRFDPFDIKLDGWSEQVNENIGDYDEIFGELHDKYKSKATMAPELKLLFQLGGSAMMVHMTNTMFKSAMPGMDDILRQNPDLMRSFQNAAVNSMAQTSPGFSGFMSNMMNPEPSVPQGYGPPPPMATQGPNAIPPPLSRPGNNNYSNRPDLNMSQSNFNNDGISLRENFERPELQDRTSKRPVRPEMKGPSDITDILSGLKTKTINIQEPSHQTQSQNNDNSTISISDLKDLQSGGNMPKRSKRRQKSASNTVSLDI
jgi:hypothetical protein